MTCAVIDSTSLVVLNIIVADATKDRPHAGTMLKTTPAPDGSCAVVGLHWLDSSSFEQPDEGPVPW